MTRRARILPLCALLLAIGVPPARAEPISPCTSNSVSLATYGPCVYLDRFLLSDISARVGAVDVTSSDQLGMTFNVDAYPPDARWLIFNVPVSGSLPVEPSGSTPLEVAYRLTGLAGSAISFVDLALLNAALAGFTSGIEFTLTSEAGTIVHRLGGAGEPMRISGPMPEPIESLDVLVRVFGTAQSSAAVGLFVAPAEPGPVPEPAPVPEPGTLALLGSGLALTLARARRRRSSAD